MIDFNKTKENGEIVHSGGDTEIAADFKRQANDLLYEVCKVMNAANNRGMKIMFQLGMDMYGRNVVTNIDVVKVL